MSLCIPHMLDESSYLAHIYTDRLQIISIIFFILYIRHTSISGTLVNSIYKHERYSLFIKIPYFNFLTYIQIIIIYTNKK